MRSLREIIYWLFFLFGPAVATLVLVRLLTDAARWAMSRRGWLDRVRRWWFDPAREVGTFLLALLSLSLLRGYGAFLPVPDWPLYIIFLLWSLRLVGEARVRITLLLEKGSALALHEAGFFVDRRGPLLTRAATVGLAVAAYFWVPPLHTLLDRITTWLLQLAARVGPAT